ncbi:glycosyltransferase family 4 protein [Kistimonas asteriae]|uniref:glycosyltransferase family 4 protein n=1 Tax=Kistimonas asteriae TaxID=517724 RepID=UPI001BAD846A|nr:glycosyltransferase [Kistimonas asteriae]
MNVLLSAYACEPNKGSEPGVGWHWAIEISKLGHQVTVLTRSNNKKNIEDKLGGMTNRNLNFYYYDLPRWLAFWKKGGRGVHLYYMLWQIGAYFVAKKLNRRKQFDLVHHITFVSARQPSFMGLLGMDFIFGPVAGGDTIPHKLRNNFSIKNKVREGLRDWINSAVKYDPLMRCTFSSAKKIVVTSEQTLSMIPEKYHQKCSMQLAIGIDSILLKENKKSFDNRQKKYCSRDINSSLKILYVGRFDYLKAIDIALMSFAVAIENGLNATFTLVGEGPEESELKKICKQLKVDQCVNWVQWLPQDELNDVYRAHDIFFFPSLRDSGGMVVLEALSNGLPVICFDLGGPGKIVVPECGYKVMNHLEISEAVLAFSQLIENFKPSNELSQLCYSRAVEFTWSSSVLNVYGE